MATSRCNEWNLGNDTTQQTQRTFARTNLLQISRDLLRTCRLCYGLVTGKSPACYGLATGKLV